MTETLYGHTLACVLAAMDRGLDDHRWLQTVDTEWERMLFSPEVSTGALCGSIEARYEGQWILCTCRPDVTICRCCMDRWMETTHGLEDVACEYHGCDHDPDLPMSLITEEIDEIGYREPYFTNRDRCDGCGSTLGGDRFDMIYV